MDNLVFEEAVNSTIDQSEFITKKWMYCNDNNTGNYSSQIVLDTTSLSNAGLWCNWSEGYLLLPLVVQLTADDPTDLPLSGAGAILADNCWAFKAGFWNLLSSYNIEFNNQNIIQQTPLTNVFRSFKAHTSFSQDDLLNEGSTLGYYPDNAGSWFYQGAVSADGRGLCNNRNAPAMLGVVNGTTAAGSTVYIGTSSAGTVANTGYGLGTSNPTSLPFGSYSFNEGMKRRQDFVGYDPANTLQGIVMPDTACDVVYRSHKRTQTVAGNVEWRVYAKLRLKDLNEFFEKCPLLKGSTMRFYLNTNQSLVDFTVAAPTIVAATGVVTPATITLNSVQVVGGQTCPLMISSAAIGSGSSSLNAGTYKLSVSIFKNTFSAQTSTYAAAQSPLSSVRLYVPGYQFNPLAQQRYLQLAPTKKVVYKDIFQYQFTGIAAGSSFNFLVSNGIPSIKSVTVIPYVGATNNGGLNYSTLLSPFTSTPATPDPIPLTNFNILVSGVNLFLNNELYDFEQFRHELMSSNQLNGNLTTGLTSGLISEDMFSRGYRYYYGNCSRILPAEAGVSRSVQIVGQNASGLIIDLLVFVEFEKEMTIDVTTGARIE